MPAAEDALGFEVPGGHSSFFYAEEVQHQSELHGLIILFCPFFWINY